MVVIEVVDLREHIKHGGEEAAEKCTSDSELELE